MARHSAEEEVNLLIGEDDPYSSDDFVGINISIEENATQDKSSMNVYMVGLTKNEALYVLESAYGAVFDGWDDDEDGD